MQHVEREEVDLEVARAGLVRMLVGAYLDSFAVSSLQISLRLINPDGQSGESLYVDLDFSCEARISDAGAGGVSVRAAEFFAGRASFLGGIYGCIGMEISGVEVGSDGSLHLAIGGSQLDLIVSEEDMDAEESIWGVAIESPVDPKSSSGDQVCCVSTGTGVAFISKRQRPR